MGYAIKITEENNKKKDKYYKDTPPQVNGDDIIDMVEWKVAHNFITTLNHGNFKNKTFLCEDFIPGKFQKFSDPFGAHIDFVFKPFVDALAKHSVVLTDGNII